MKNKIDAIPLTVIRDDVSAIESFHSADEENASDKQVEVVRKKPGHGGRRSIRVNSTYISQKDRLSRYKTALETFIPFRSSNGDTHSELPVDSIGCFSNLSFLWVRDFLLTPADDPLMDSRHNRKKYELSFSPTYNDRADVNGKRLLGIYKDEIQTRGKCGSMMRVAWNFCRTRVIIASLFYMLSTLSALCAPVFFLKFTLDSLKSETMLSNGNTSLNGTSLNQTSVAGNYKNIFKLFTFTFSFYGRFDCVYYMLGFSGCIFAAMIFKGITNWMNLRTAIRLRSAVVAATYRRAIKSSVNNNISAHQILTDDIDAMMDLVDYLTKIVGTLVAMILALAASIVLLNGPGVWPILAAVGFFCIPPILAKISTWKLRKSMHFLIRKMTVIEEFCTNFKDIMIHALAYDYIKQFYYFNSSQFSALRYSKIFSVRIYDGLTSVLLGGLYLIWCDADIETNNVEVLVLLIVYVFFIKNFVTDYCYSMEAISNGKASLEKLKNSFGVLTSPELSRVRTIDTRLLISMSQCKFKCEENVSFTIEVAKGDILGVTGKHMKALIYSILGHSECKDGIFRQRGVTGFFSENPFISVGSIKDNILMGSDFNAKRYFTAITATKLNDDVLQTLGSDELPIESLDLTKQQKQRVALARAIYSDRDIYLFDEPFKSAVFSSNILQMFANVVDMIASDPDKAVIICSTNSQILNICHRVYDTNENQIYTRADYERISAVSYHDGPVHYTFENIKGCCQNALTVYKMPSRFHVQVVAEHHGLPDESTEHLIAKEKQKATHSIGIINMIFLSILNFITSSIHVLLIVGFILVVLKSYIEPWLNLLFLGAFFLTFLIELIQKIYMAKILETKQKKLHKIIFEKLLNTSLDYLCGTNIADILNWLSATCYSQFQPYTKIIESVLMIAICSILLIITNYWLTSAVVVILVIGQVFSIHYIFKGRLKSTLNYFVIIEFESRKRMFQNLINNLRGRDVIQSFERTSEFCREFNVIIEDNSTAVFMQRSVKNYVSFILQMIMAANVTLIYIVTTIIGEISIYNFMFSILMYYLLMQHVNDLITEGYIELMIAQCKIKLIELEVKNIVNNKQVSLLYEPSPSLGDGGIAIDFKDVLVKLCGKNILSIKKLHIERGDIIGITGNGSHLISAVLFKLLKPALGVVFLGNHELSLISIDNLHALIDVVPYDLKIQNLTIAEFLNPNNSLSHKAILNKVQEVLPQVLNKPNKLMELVRSLTRRERQLLCLVKASVAKPMIVIIEFPDIEIQSVINLFVKRDFYNKTIVIVGTNHRHFEACTRIVNLDLLSK